MSFIWFYGTYSVYWLYKRITRNVFQHDRNKLWKFDFLKLGQVILIKDSSRDETIVCTQLQFQLQNRIVWIINATFSSVLQGQGVITTTFPWRALASSTDLMTSCFNHYLWERCIYHFQSPRKCKTCKLWIKVRSH